MSACVWGGTRVSVLVCSLMHYGWKHMSLYSAVSLPFFGCSLDMFLFDQLNTDILILTLNSYERFIMVSRATVI